MNSIFILYILISIAICQESLLGKLYVGYQGWFTTQSDGSGNGWTHFKMHSQKPFAKNNCVIDFWPETSEYQKKYPVTQFGGDYSLFSPYDYSTVKTHFRWMSQSNIQGAFLQRFGSDIKNKGSNMWKFKNRVLQNIMNAANEFKRHWCLMYDLSGLQQGEIKSVIIQDFKFLKQTYNFGSNPSNYVYHKNKPLVTIWGIGFNDNRKYSLNQCKQLTDFLKNQGFTVMVGVPRYWREGGRDAVTGDQLALLHSIIKTVDVVNPWTVGRYGTIQQARIDARINVKNDIDWCNQNHVTLIPVIFPGFSWHNLQVSGENPDHPGPYDQIPRRQNGTYFLQDQGNEVAKVGARTIYVAMFDEMNEGTAIFKCSRKPPSLSDGLRFVQYNQDPGFYLGLAGKISRLLK